MKYWVIPIFLLLILISGCNRPTDATRTTITTTIERIEITPTSITTTVTTTTQLSQDEISKNTVRAFLESKGYFVNEVYISRSTKDGFYVGVNLKWDGKYASTNMEMVANGWMALHKEFPDEENYQVALEDKTRQKIRCYFTANKVKLINFEEWITKRKYIIGDNLNGYEIAEQWDSLFSSSYCEDY